MMIRARGSEGVHLSRCVLVRLGAGGRADSVFSCSPLSSFFFACSYVYSPYSHSSVSPPSSRPMPQSFVPGERSAPPRCTHLRLSRLHHTVYTPCSVLRLIEHEFTAPGFEGRREDKHALAVYFSHHHRLNDNSTSLIINFNLDASRISHFPPLPSARRTAHHPTPLHLPCPSHLHLPRPTPPPFLHPFFHRCNHNQQARRPSRSSFLGSSDRSNRCGTTSDSGAGGTAWKE